MTERAAGGSVLFDTGPLRTGSLFREPIDIVEAWHPRDIEVSFDKLEAARSEGKWIAGCASYELGYTLIPKISSRTPAIRSQPLMQFGIFDGPDTPPRTTPTAEVNLGPFTPAWSFDTYRRAFGTVHNYLKSGDIYQANLTFPMSAVLEGCPHSLYEALKRKQPVPYGALVDLGGAKLLSRSPELFFSLSQMGELRTRPMKGTIRRSPMQTEDEDLKHCLAHSEKDRAENLMITDLLRNDLSRISEVGSVSVPKLFEIESYTTVHQMISEVVSQILPNRSLMDIFTALFPCGSITGAPKIRAMDILANVETTPRGSYCGTIGWIAPDGTMEFNVAIRTLICEPSGQVTLNVGGGIVYDSTAAGEYHEAKLKALFAKLCD
ncbi:aminodeoxychorismate synthase component I [uncultured Tateyamaria sp.]|uniref:aminodeoxychorismate synthase component I n=1 Tax=uncultured Tateyamaria sp. TaxID=455651 RepID=UPI00260E95F3|nr:aminodeoxychorismate synthase component I [uncultured Tateyamaria sp.]